MSAVLAQEASRSPIEWPRREGFNLLGGSGEYRRVLTSLPVEMLYNHEVKRPTWSLVMLGFAPCTGWFTRDALAQRVSRRVLCAGLAQLKELGWVEVKVDCGLRLYRLRVINSQSGNASRVRWVVYDRNAYTPGTITMKMHMVIQTDPRWRNLGTWRKVLDASYDSVSRGIRDLKKAGLIDEQVRGRLAACLNGGEDKPPPKLASQIQVLMDGKTDRQALALLDSGQRTSMAVEEPKAAKSGAKKYDPQEVLVKLLERAMGTAKQVEPSPPGKGAILSELMEAHSGWQDAGGQSLEDHDVDAAARIVTAHLCWLANMVKDCIIKPTLSDVLKVRDTLVFLQDPGDDMTRARHARIHKGHPFDLAILGVEALFTKKFSGFTFKPCVLFKIDGSNVRFEEYALNAAAKLQRWQRETGTSWRQHYLGLKLQAHGASLPLLRTKDYRERHAAFAAAGKKRREEAKIPKPMSAGRIAVWPMLPSIYEFYRLRGEAEEKLRQEGIEMRRNPPTPKERREKERLRDAMLRREWSLYMPDGSLDLRYPDLFFKEHFPDIFNAVGYKGILNETEDLRERARADGIAGRDQFRTPEEVLASQQRRESLERGLARALAEAADRRKRDREAGG